MATRMVTGYVRGKAFSLIVVERDGVLMEAATALAYDEMQEAAARDGVRIVATSGWRSNDEQQRIWQQRKNPDIRAEKGPAAKPGWSNHQSGIALDLRTGMTVADLAIGHKSKVYLWLEEHARKFGFVRTVEIEPWHYERVLPLGEDRS